MEGKKKKHVGRRKLNLLQGTEINLEASLQVEFHLAWRNFITGIAGETPLEQSIWDRKKPKNQKLTPSEM